MHGTDNIELAAHYIQGCPKTVR